jgi:hypothetical protein
MDGTVASHRNRDRRRRFRRVDRQVLRLRSVRWTADWSRHRHHALHRHDGSPHSWLHLLGHAPGRSVVCIRNCHRRVGNCCVQNAGRFPRHRHRRPPVGARHLRVAFHRHGRGDCRAGSNGRISRVGHEPRASRAHHHRRDLYRSDLCVLCRERPAGELALRGGAERAKRAARGRNALLARRSFDVRSRPTAHHVQSGLPKAMAFPKT